ncbi:MAG: NAD(P)/FAD-dependent oxidoreductase [Alphaproteobacteria bacterium]
MANTGSRNVTVIGAGIVGTATANYLLREGHKVTLIERDEPGKATSFGNLGGISPGSVVPVATPGMLKQIPKWLLDPEGPLFVRWYYLPQVMPWLVKFLLAGRRDRVYGISKALSSLNGPTFEAYQPLLKAAGAEHLFHRTGQLFLYQSKESQEKDALGIELRKMTGQRCDILNKDEIRQLEPALAPVFESAILMPDHGHCKNPFGLVQALAQSFTRGGGIYLNREVRGFEMGPNGPVKLHTSQGDLPVEDIVIAGGAWSNVLTKQLGHDVPLESHRGYHVTVEDPGFVPRIMCFPVERKFAITPMEMGLRIGGTVELAGLDAEPNYERARVLLKMGKRFIPGLKTDKFTEWMGHRPCHPDSLPVIGGSPKWKNVFFAFGHGHQGLLGASQTGKVLSELLSGKPLSMDLTPFRVDRF